MKAYKVIKSNIHRKGLCANLNIKKGKRVIEYKGKKITHKLADEDTKYGYDITYLFTLDTKYLLDGDFEFNKARLINHSCNPNCEVLDESKSKIQCPITEKRAPFVISPAYSLLSVLLVICTFVLYEFHMLISYYFCALLFKTG